MGSRCPQGFVPSEQTWCRGPGWRVLGSALPVSPTGSILGGREVFSQPVPRSMAWASSPRPLQRSIPGAVGLRPSLLWAPALGGPAGARVGPDGPRGPCRPQPLRDTRPSRPSSVLGHPNVSWPRSFGCRLYLTARAGAGGPVSAAAVRGAAQDTPRRVPPGLGTPAQTSGPCWRLQGAGV